MEDNDGVLQSSTEIIEGSTLSFGPTIRSEWLSVVKISLALAVSTMAGIGEVPGIQNVEKFVSVDFPYPLSDMLCWAAATYVVLKCFMVWISINSSSYTISARGVMASYGFISKSTIEAPLNQGALVQIEQSVMGRLLGYGDLYVTLNTNNAATDTRIPLLSVSDPVYLAEVVKTSARISGMQESVHEYARYGHRINTQE